MAPVTPNLRKITRILILMMAMAAAHDGPATDHLAAQVSFPEVANAAARAPSADLVVPYGRAEPQFGELRIPPPGTRSDPPPVVMLLHGGCWLDRYGVDHVAPIAEALRSAGMAVWAPEYRRIGDEGGGIPGTFDDLRAGWQTLLSLVAAHQLDPDRILLMGHSAGGHLALWLAGESGVRVRGVLSLAGITDLEAYHAPAGCGASVSPLMGGTPAAIPETYRQHSPATRAPLGPATPVTLVIGQDDAIVPETQARAYRDRDPHAAVLAVPGGHFDLIAPWTPAWSSILGLTRNLLGIP
jgi:acetyl esterase/lipase